MMDKNEEQHLNLLVAKAKEKYGVEAGIDPSKSFDENKDAILQAVKKAKETAKNLPKALPKSLPTGRQKEPPKPPEKSAEERKREAEELTRIIQEANKSIKCDNREITTFYERLRKSVELTARGYFNCCFTDGRGGIGKSYQIISKLNEMGLVQGKDYIVFSGEISQAFLYRFIYQNNEKLIVFKDLAKLITQLDSLEMLKGMTETHGKRIIHKQTYSKRDEDLPPYFEVKSNFIFEFNKLPRGNGLEMDIEALFSRGDHVSVSLSFRDIADIMLKIAKTDEEREITRFLIENYNFVGINALNLRLQQKAFRIHKWARENNLDWEKEIMLFLNEMSYVRKTLYSYIGDRAVKSSELKKIMVLANLDNVNNLRMASYRLRDWVLTGKLFIVGFNSNDVEEIEDFLNSHRNYALSLTPITAEREQILEKRQLEAVAVLQGA